MFGFRENIEKKSSRHQKIHWFHRNHRGYWLIIILNSRKCN